MSLETLFSKSRPSIFTKTSALSRFTAPLANRSRNVAEFNIEPDDPWKTYSPGEAVRGCVVLTVAKPVAITHLVICLHGHAQVYKNQVVPGDGPAASGFLGPGRGSRGVEYLGNGFTSLFQDEVVLCGEGLLGKGIYKFKFDLGFPPQGLPSSIDFERGTVSYFFTATLTRATTIAPTLSCHRQVLFQDSIDVGHLPMPKPCVISLEPMSTRARVKAKVKQTPLDKVQESFTRGGLRRSASGNSQPSNQSSPDPPPLSPAPSDISSTSAVTTSSQSFQIVNSCPSTIGASGKNADAKSNRISTSLKAITATTELLKPGALPGEVVPLKICITHTKSNIRGLIIVTLYRQGRIDMHPPLPVKTKNKGKGYEYEDVYPQSRTGLGGLHFSNSLPSSVFRKDLCQTSVMMVVNPHTFTADVRTSIKVPEDAFPTMANVPGGMIEFKYYVEVVIDMCGKLGEPRLLPRISLTSQPQSFTNANGTGSLLHVTSKWADNILDTAQLRRGKDVVVCLFEVTVGSKDSTRATKKWSDMPLAASQRSTDIPETDQPSFGREYQGGDLYHDEEYSYRGWPQDSGTWQDHQMPVSRFVPPPEPEEEVDEKTRLRREEALLLPSHPPDGGGSLTPVEAFLPSAPFIPEEAALYHDHPVPEGEAEFNGAQLVPSATSARSVDTIIPSYPHSRLPMPDSHRNESSLDDKHELERQRLMTQASAPPTADEGAPGIAPTIATPSAPTLSEEDEYNAHTMTDDHAAGDNLPRYKR